MSLSSPIAMVPPRRGTSSSSSGQGWGRDQHFDFVLRDEQGCRTGRMSMLELCAGGGLSPEYLVTFLPPTADLTSQTLRDELSAKFKIPASFWSSMAQEASGFFECRDDRAADGTLEHFGSSFRFLVKVPVRTNSYGSNLNNLDFSYTWTKSGFCTSWTPPNHITILCFGLPVPQKESITQTMLSSTSPSEFIDPFSTHVLIERVLEMYDSAVWSWRDLIRALELSRPVHESPEPDYTTMHEIGRHIIHCSETLAIALETMNSLVYEHQAFYDENLSLPQDSKMAGLQVRRQLRSQISVFRCLHMRSKALEERLRNEINLAFNIVAQRESRAAVRIGEAAQVDGAAMKTVSVLGLVFLPGTFICAIFSTTFFSFSPGNGVEPQVWVVSEKFWIYWAVMIPVTTFTILCWYIWQRGGRLWLVDK